MLTATRVRALRLSRFISQRELARRAQITEATLSRLERGEQSPHFLTLGKLSRALEVPVGDLVDQPEVDAVEQVA